MKGRYGILVKKQGFVMPRTRIFLSMIALLFSSLACATLMGEDPYYDETYYSDEETEILTEEAPPQENDPGSPQSLTCPVVTDAILEAALTPGESETEEMDGEIYLVTYSVNGDELFDPYYEDVSADLEDEQMDESAHREIWDQFSSLIPAQHRSMIAEYSIFTDGADNVLAAVAQTQSDPSTWSLQVDIADISDPYNLTFTLIHEYGHLLTLGPDQVPPSLAIFNNPEDEDIYFQEASACPNYFPGEGCAEADSYIDDFYNEFWLDISEEWNQVNLEEDDDAYYEALDAFYAKYADQFVTDYAATNPEEDIAESWTFFVLSPEPEGNTIADQKILFFYRYPELVELRTEILKNVCVNHQ